MPEKEKRLGRTPLPPEKRRKMFSTRLIPEVKDSIAEHSQLLRMSQSEYIEFLEINSKPVRNRHLKRIEKELTPETE